MADNYRVLVSPGNVLLMALIRFLDGKQAGKTTTAPAVHLGWVYWANNG